MTVKYRYLFTMMTVLQLKNISPVDKLTMQEQLLNENIRKVIAKPWTLSVEDTLAALAIDPRQGLSTDEALARTKKYGPNTLQEIKPRSSWIIFIDQFKNLIVYFLVAAALLSFILGDHVEGLAIVAVIMINAAIGFVTELKGVRSIEALRMLGTVNSRVRRNGAVSDIPAQNLVPGDIIVLEGGDIITADLRILNASKLLADESPLTGESMPVAKSVYILQDEVPLAERANMLFKGTAVTRGSGEAVVIGTGMATELGTISSLVHETVEETTPLEKRLDQLGHWLIWVSLGVAALVGVSGILAGRDIILMIETGIALAVASIPEGLPIVATIAMARGVWRMAKRNALVKDLAAVETLGATSVICTDKTGTLTENRLTAAAIALDNQYLAIDVNAEKDSMVFVTGEGGHVVPAENPPLLRALEVSVLCNNAEIPDPENNKNLQVVGDPLEVAMLTLGARFGLTRKAMNEEFPEELEDAFDSETKMMATYHRLDGEYRVAAKGAPENILAACDAILTRDGRQPLSGEDRDYWLQKNDEMAAAGLRVLALAEKQVDHLEESAYQNLIFLGLMGLIDPPREDVKQVLQECREAGVRVIMATGDQPVTAQAIGYAVGLVDDPDTPVFHGIDLKPPEMLSPEDKGKLLAANLFARVSPKQKLDIIALHRDNGAIVAMTGDGVNDAPALKKADIGIAMGMRGTQVAREASDIILKDDSFASIVHAVEQGRIIFKNIKSFVVYLLSCNLSEIMTVGLASFVNAPLPLLPLQILFLNLVTDVFPALALAASEASPDIMKQPPRRKGAPIMDTRRWISVGVYGFIITAAVLAAMAMALKHFGMEEQKAVTISFLTLAFAQLWHVFNMRDKSSGLINNAIVRNSFVWGALVLCSLLTVATVYVPLLAQVLQVTDPGATGWMLIIGMSLLPMIVGQIGLTAMKILGRA
ncbi:MAG: cation-transporting P-type ATPase [Desulfobulbales bacterium]|nr:cation-transporting P-type ATPase [Desulfobulbales bacterium]